MRAVVITLGGMAALLVARPAAADPDFGFTRVDQLSTTAAFLEVSWNGNGKDSRGEIRLSEDAQVAQYRVVNAVGLCTSPAGEHVGPACNAQVQWLVPGKTYYFRTAVKWRNAEGEHEALGPIVSFTTPGTDPRTPPEVSNPRIMQFTESWVQFNYHANGYDRPYRTTARCEAPDAPAVDGAAESHRAYPGASNVYVRVNGLKPATAYTCTLTAESDFGTASIHVPVTTDTP